MKSTIVFGLAAVVFASTTVLAQTYKQSGPFFLKLVAPRNATLDGQYLFACHAGAAIEGLCLGGTTAPSPTDHSSRFYFNQTSYDGTTVSDTGYLVWNLPLVGPNDTTSVSEGMSLQYRPDTNVAIPMLQPSYGQQEVGFNNSALYIPSYYDDRHLVDGVYPNSTLTQRKQWYACYAELNGYYYTALAWVTAGKPQNPTCRAVGVVQAWMARGYGPWW